MARRILTAYERVAIWREAAEAPKKIYRGIRLTNLPPEVLEKIRKLQRPAMNEDEVGQHLQIGPMLLDHIHNTPWKPFANTPDDLQYVGPGRHWTRRKDFAETAASNQIGPGIGVILEADDPGEDHYDPDLPMTAKRPDGTGWEDEEEATLLPDTPLNYTSIRMPHWFQEEVLDDPYYHNMEQEYGRPYPGGPRPGVGGIVHDPFGKKQAAYERVAIWREAEVINVPEGPHDINLYGPPSDGNGRWAFPHDSVDPDTGSHYWRVDPTRYPALHESEIHGRPNRIYYDPARVKIEHDGIRPRAVHPEGTVRTLANDLNPEYIWRGMSDEEYQEAKERGYFESRGGHNLGEEQVGKTFFTTRPSSADSYASSYAPYEYVPTFDRPAHVVGIPDRPDVPRGALGEDPRSHEVGISGRIPFSEVAEHWVGNVAALSPGEFKVTTNPDIDGPPHRSLSPTADLQWERDPEFAPRTAARTAMPAVDAYDGGRSGDLYRKLSPPGHRIAPEGTQWYHRSQHELPDGAVLGPHGGKGGMTPEDVPEYLQGRHQWVWMDRNSPTDYSSSPDGFLYEVSPSEGPYPWNGEGLEGWVAPSARVVRKVKARRTAMPWYHRTDDELNPGDSLLPYNQIHPDHQEVGNESWNPNKAYVYDGEEDDSSDHAPYAGYGQHIYEIEPHGDPQRDYGDGNYSSHMIDRGTVIKRLPDEDPYSFGEKPQWADPSAHTAARHLTVQQVRPRKAKTMTAAITVYTKPSCVQCTMTRKQLDKLGIEHQVIDVTADPDAHAYVTGLGYQTAPVVVVGDGERHWSGFSPDKIKALMQ